MKLPEILSTGEYHSSRSVGWHHHNGPELVWVVQGTCSTTIHNHCTLKASAGTLLILPAKIPHKQDSYGVARTWYIAFEQPPIDLDFSPRVLDVSQESTLKKWMSWISHPSSETHAGWDSSRSCLVMAILERIRHIEMQAHSAKLYHPALAFAILYLNDHFTHEITLCDLAVKSGVSTSLLKLLFRKILSTSPIHYRNELRMLHAKKLLSSPYLTVNEVAAQCGFADPNYFVRLFHQWFGISPGAWRKSSLQ